MRYSEPYASALVQPGPGVASRRGFAPGRSRTLSGCCRYRGRQWV